MKKIVTNQVFQFSSELLRFHELCVLVREPSVLIGRRSLQNHNQAHIERVSRINLNREINSDPIRKRVRVCARDWNEENYFEILHGRNRLTSSRVSGRLRSEGLKLWRRSGVSENRRNGEKWAWTEWRVVVFREF